MITNTTVIFLSCVLLLIVTLSNHVAEAVNDPLVLMKLNAADYPNAKCLDGSPGGYYYSEGESSSKVILFFQGGAWCHTPENCLVRSNTTLGSSVNLGPKLNQHGFMSNDCELNPQFCKFRKIFFAYCDGASFTGTTSFTVGGKTLYSHGNAIVDAVLDHAMKHHDLHLASEVIVSGCSAGGLASILHTNRVHDFVTKNVPKLTQFGTVVVSGVFVDGETVEGNYVYRQQIQQVSKIAQPSLGPAGFQHPCLDYYAQEPWRCMFAPYMLPFLRTPVFVINSVIDSWQMPCVLASQPYQSTPYVSYRCVVVC